MPYLCISERDERTAADVFPRSRPPTKHKIITLKKRKEQWDELVKVSLVASQEE